MTINELASEKRYVFFPSYAFIKEINALPAADLSVQEEVMEEIKQNKMTIVSGMYLGELEGKTLSVVRKGDKFFDGETREITNLERVSKGIVLVTHKPSLK